MRYLNCIEMLNYALRVLKADSRQPVPVAKMNELLTCLNSVQKMMTNEQVSDALTSAVLNDLMGATLTVTSQTVGMKNITDTMKQELISGVLSVKSSIAEVAFFYYSKHEFEDDPAIVPLMRDVVEMVAEKGLLT